MVGNQSRTAPTCSTVDASPALDRCDEVTRVELGRILGERIRSADPDPRPGRAGFDRAPERNGASARTIRLQLRQRDTRITAPAGRRRGSGHLDQPDVVGKVRQHGRDLYVGAHRGTVRPKDGGRPAHPPRPPVVDLAEVADPRYLRQGNDRAAVSAGCATAAVTIRGCPRRRRRDSQRRRQSHHPQRLSHRLSKALGQRRVGQIDRAHRIGRTAFLPVPLSP